MNEQEALALLQDRAALLGMLASEMAVGMRGVCDDDLITDVKIVPVAARDRIVITFQTTLEPDEIEESAGAIETELSTILCRDHLDSFMRDNDVVLEFELLSIDGRRGIGFEISEVLCLARGYC